MTSKTIRFFAISCWTASIFAIQADAQISPGGFEPVSGATISQNGPNGFHLFGATLSAGYSSSLGWLGSTWSPVVTHPLFYEEASVLVGYTRVAPRSALAIGYNPSYSGLNGMGGLQFLNQRLSLAYTRNYGPKWSLRLRGEAADTTFQEFLFATNSLDPLSEPSSALAGATLRETANPQTLLYGNRQFMYSARIGVQYKPSNRLSISVETGVDQVQALRHSDYSVTAIIPRARSEVANAGLTYALSTRTELQTIVVASDTQSPSAHYQIANISEGVLRRLTQHWWSWFQAGAGIYRTRFSSVRSPAFTTYLAGGGAGYRGRANTFGFIFNKRIGDSFGLGSGSTYGFQAGWNWHRPGSSWGLDAGGEQQRMSGGYLGKFSLWQAGAGVTRALSARTYFRAEYAYLLDTAIPDGFFGRPRAHGVRLTFGWNALGHGRPRVAVPTPGPSSGI